jgi:glutathione synthase/RimK-type ligase-like ATP-grasp enzyme
MLRWATCRDLPEPDHDEALFFEACARAGIPVQKLAWDDPADIPAEDDTVLIRSTWNYPWFFDEFRNWVQVTGTRCRLVNPPEIVLANLNKTYLRDLDVPIVPTTFVAPGDDIEFPSGPFVVKPSVGAGSYRTQVFDEKGPKARDFVNEILRDSLAMVQPLIESVYTVGEHSLVYIDGEFTHKIIKKPRFEGHDESVSAGLPLEDRDLKMGHRVIAGLGAGLVYARVDLMEIDGDWAVSEIELTEPSLFLSQSPHALEKLVNWAKSVPV